ncbi:TIGR03089 family protein [Tomitella biformata]|uniref:TIGR03089 family protein n=1 Tax=Tomitella biformata TaxID=630403 RepID=UPI00046578F7|nr:TIGR03089 family protein [Tomitella biformata]
MTASRTLTDLLIDPILAASPANPLVTYYDDATGERVELSAITLMNWVAKTANMLRDEFGLAAGDRVCVLMPAHWQTVAVLLGAWWNGCEVVLEADPANGGPTARLAVVTAERMDEVQDIDEIAVCSLDAFGRAVPDLPPTMTDYASTVRIHGDHFSSTRISGAAPALDGRSITEVLEVARAARVDLGPSDRVLSQRNWNTVDKLVDGLLAVLAAGSSLVQVANMDPSALERRMTSEKVTRQL